MTVTASPLPLTRRDRALAVTFGIWMVVGLFLDGWAHDNNQPESFFTPWHGVLYSGFAGAAAVSLLPVMRQRREAGTLREAIPPGHMVTLVALAFFAAAALGDLAWHETIGIEVGVEALLSPTHLVLLVSGITALSGPFRSAWSTDGADSSLRAFLPVALSVALTTGVLGFFLAYLSPFVNDAGGTRFDRVASTPHDHPPTDSAELLQLLGIASILVASVLVACAVQLLVRRWRPPAGTFTVMLTIVLTLFAALDVFRQPLMVVAGVLAGVAGDAAVRAQWKDWAIPGVVVAALWASFFAIRGVAYGGVLWSGPVWSGVLVLSTLLALGIGFIGRRDGAPAR